MIINPATPAEAGQLLDADGDGSLRVILLARDRGWHARDEDQPGTDVAALAERALAAPRAVTEDELDALRFRYCLDAEAWLNDRCAPAGYQFGWHGQEFWLTDDSTWARWGGPDQMFL